MRTALGIAYDGSALAGWQRQPQRRTAQGLLEAALSQIADAPIELTAAGRTDAGVHATGQVVHFDSLAERPLRAWVRGTNSKLPASVRVRWARQVDSCFHARFSAVARRYIYLFSDDSMGLPQVLKQTWSGPALDAPAMHRAAQALLGEQDFSAVRAAGCQSATPMRFVQQVVVQRLGALVVLDISANAFVLHMVRNIASALRQVGLGQRPEGWLMALLAGRDRRVLGPTAPPQGLSLVDVRYAEADAAEALLPQPTGAPPALLSTVATLDRL
ncbi:MAG: tRNA pseudouridine(38-40) synthase TruA [Pseudomonadota bacterium]